MISGLTSCEDDVIRAGAITMLRMQPAVSVVHSCHKEELVYAPKKKLIQVYIMKN